MMKAVYDPDKDGLIAIAQLASAVCSETEADNKIAALVVATDTLWHSNDASKTVPTAEYTKVKECKLNAKIGNVVRIKFTISGSVGSADGWGQIYRNGIAIGTERHRPADSANPTFSEDFDSSGWVADDLIQIYGKKTAFVITISAFRFYSSLGFSVTNQDP